MQQATTLNNSQQQQTIDYSVLWDWTFIESLRNLHIETPPAR